MSFVAIAVTAGAAVSVVGQLQAAEAAEDQADYNAKVAENEARQRELEDHEDVKRMRADKRKAMAQARARVAASGGVVDAGSNFDLMQALDSRLETEIQDKSRRALLEVQSLRTSGEISKWRGEQSATALKIGAAGTLLDSARSGLGKYRDWKRNS